jgi:hypothetical protein
MIIVISICVTWGKSSEKINRRIKHVKVGVKWVKGVK